MQYVLLIYGDEKAWEARDERDREANMEAHAKFSAMLREHNALLGGEELAGSSSATTVRNVDRVGVTDGPFAETAEQLGGYYVIEAADLDTAIGFARQLPEPIVEVRPIVMHPEADS
ncbi:YciI family protein [Paractinoplanes globisporus]|uniref:YciI family protein n=1 Tax=Paractinoplanes globisporus TaxID=113565 RepID=A0ABW6WIX4_9ACTN|nr:YciI family protein [Actinoplanes globisporus]